jgi:hexokinase
MDLLQHLSLDRAARLAAAPIAALLQLARSAAVYGRIAVREQVVFLDALFAPTVPQAATFLCVRAEEEKRADKRAVREQGLPPRPWAAGHGRPLRP